MKFHLLTISSSLLLGAGLSAIQPGNFFLGWLLFSFLFLLSFYVLRFASTWATNVQRSTFNLQLIILLAFLLRLALGVTLYLGLPVAGYPNPQSQAGYIFFDSFRRDEQAWELAQSDAPILSAFNKDFYSDQYGGLLAFDAAAYRTLSPDAHRPLLPVFFGALTAALGLAFLWKVAARQWDEKIATAAAWIYALFPESILLGSAQMREPFLMAFVAMALWGFVVWRAAKSPRGERGADWKSALLWLALGFAGMLLVSPAIALLMLVILVGWMWVGREYGRVSWIALVAAGLVFFAGLYLLAWGLEREQAFGSSPLGIILNWSRDAIKWDIYQLVRGSGWVQKLFNEMPESLHPLFVMVYGITQPVLPATFIEPSTPFIRVLMIFRALGWYALVPLLFYAPFAVFRTQNGSARRLWLWLIAVTWLWIIVSALRGGADQWDNPRYRVILIAVQALVAGFAWVNRDRWLVRWLAVEVAFLAVFTQWYVSRYYRLGEQLPFGVMIALIVFIAALILVGGWWRDRKVKR
jgi:4-amino-4-deoxy-L-arabinose transferase-like glycosyltransferase